MEFLIERSFLKLVVDSENEFPRSLLLRCSISEQLRRKLFEMNTICMERSSIFLRKRDHFARCNVELQNEWVIVEINDVLKRRIEIRNTQNSVKFWSPFSIFVFLSSTEWLPLWRNTSPVRWFVYVWFVRISMKSKRWWRTFYRRPRVSQGIFESVVQSKLS